VGEFTLAKVRKAALEAGLPVEELSAEVKEAESPVEELNLPSRPPALCPGCPHRAFFYNLRRYKRRAVFSGDIGCYSMGVLPPFESMDMLISMGASVGMAHGLKQAGAEEEVIATIGDSTFFHSGLSPLASSVYNRGKIVVAVLDNRITAMTGGQQHPGTGITLQGEDGQRIEIAPVARAMGIKHVQEIDAWDVEAVDQALKDAMAEEETAVLVFKGACVFTPHFERRAVVAVDEDTCTACGTCFRVGCPAIQKSDAINERSGLHKASVDPLLCTGCTVCLQTCPVDAIYETGGEVAS
jgi:indolepyruvate ferredoxin oxidoreductase alpha subunit